ncbi:hypothetical protein Tco_0857908 [Tanacetum coccineum]|uniref:Uncharacterized protein n=1 Tax=Tanacetum coccineum TaxID=301880 RepID=A0ABQ5B7J0_9ASTR
MLVEKKYPLRKDVLMQMMKLKLESEEDSTMALELIKFVKKLLAEVLNSPCFPVVKELLFHDQIVMDVDVAEKSSAEERIKLKDQEMFWITSLTELRDKFEET